MKMFFEEYGRFLLYVIIITFVLGLFSILKDTNPSIEEIRESCEFDSAIGEFSYTTEDLGS